MPVTQLTQLTQSHDKIQAIQIRWTVQCKCKCEMLEHPFKCNSWTKWPKGVKKNNKVKNQQQQPKKKKTNWTKNKNKSFKLSKVW